MQQMTRFSKRVRLALLAGSLLAALAAGSVAADSTEVGLLACDHGCVVETLSDGSADFTMVNVTPFDASGYESAGPGELGYTR